MENLIESKPLRINLAFLLIACFTFTNEIVCLDVEVTANSKNVALFRSTFQSSDHDNSTTSDLAVDDNATTCSVTGKQKGASWTVVLDDIVPISQIRMNLGGEFFGENIELHVSSVTGEDLGSLCSFGTNSVAADFVNVSCFSGPVMARKVNVRNKFNGIIRLCDFQVLVCNDGFFGVECTKQCHCDGDSLCDKTNGQCPGLCAPGMNGTDCQSACADGFFGPSCQRTCHCTDDLPCDKQTGDCPTGCAGGWVGPGCQTGIPKLVDVPKVFRADVTQITITWQSWIHFVDPTITLLYKIEFKLSSDVHGDQTWIEGPMQADTDHFNENKTITGLQRNSFYIFRVIPVLRISSTEMIEGGPSPESVPIRTKCTVPETPNITNAYSWVDTSRHMPVAVLSVEWTLLTQKQSNCENILYYEIFYQKRGYNWKSTGAKKTEHAKNISSDVSFESEYLVRVLAHNNHPYQSSSDTKIVMTPRASINRDYTVRLNNSQSSEISSMEGRLEIYYNGTWGTVCDDGFTNASARVACASLGFGHVGRVINRRRGSGTGHIWLDDVVCVGTEEAINKCSHNAWGHHNCNHIQDVSISCDYSGTSTTLVDDATPGPDIKVIAIAALASLMGLGILLAVTFAYRNTHKTRQAERDNEMRTRGPSGRLASDQTMTKTGETGYEGLRSSGIYEHYDELIANEYDVINEISEEISESPYLKPQSDSFYDEIED